MFRGQSATKPLTRRHQLLGGVQRVRGPEGRAVWHRPHFHSSGKESLVWHITNGIATEIETATAIANGNANENGAMTRNNAATKLARVARKVMKGGEQETTAAAPEITGAAPGGADKASVRVVSAAMA